MFRLVIHCGGCLRHRVEGEAPAVLQNREDVCVLGHKLVDDFFICKVGCLCLVHLGIVEGLFLLVNVILKLMGELLA